MTKATYYDSFIPLAENEIDKPEDASFFFCKSFTNDKGLKIMEGYTISSKNLYYLKRIIYQTSKKDPKFINKLIVEHKSTYPKIPFIVRYLTKEKLIFTLVEHHYDEHTKYKGKNILSGQHPWFWEDEATFDADNQQITYKKYILNEQLDVVKEQLYDRKNGILLDEEQYED